MNCEKVKNLFSAYLEGPLGAKQAQGVERHLAECAECKAEFEETAGLCEMLGAMEAPRVPANLERYVSARINSELLERARGKPTDWLAWLRGALAVGAVGAVILLGYFVTVGDWNGFIASIWGGSAGPEQHQPTSLGRPMVNWAKGSPQITLRAEADGAVEIDLLSQGRGLRLDTFRVERGQLVKLPVEGLDTRGEPAMLTVTTSMGGGEEVTTIILPCGARKQAGQVRGDALEVLGAVASAYDVAVVVRGGLPDTDISADCEAAGAYDALRSSAGLTDYRRTLSNRVLTLQSP